MEGGSWRGHAVIRREQSLMQKPKSKRAYVCAHPGCARAFAKKWNLTAHERLHTGARPFVCRLGCGARQMWLSSLKSHETRRCRLLPPERRARRRRRRGGGGGDEQPGEVTDGTRVLDVSTDVSSSARAVTEQQGVESKCVEAAEAAHSANTDIAPKPTETRQKAIGNASESLQIRLPIKKRPTRQHFDNASFSRPQNRGEGERD